MYLPIISYFQPKTHLNYKQKLQTMIQHMYVICTLKLTLHKSVVLRKDEILGHDTRVARWHILIPKILIWVYFGGPWNGKSIYIFWPIGIFYGQLEYFTAITVCLMAIRYIFPSLVYCSKKNLAPLHDTCRKEKTIHSQGIG
jgi:hypothetical protein